MQQTEECADQELLDAYGRGREEAAFAEIVRRHSRWVFAAAYRQLHDRQLAEDAVQMVFVLLATKAKHLEKDVKLSGWLFNATQFTVRNFRRMDRRRAARELAAQRREVVADVAPDSEMAARLDEAVAKLPAKDRAAVLLRYYQEQSIEEVARATGVSQAAAGKRVQRAVAALRRLLGIRGEDAVGMLAGYGLAHCPAELNHVVCRVALAARAGLPLPAGVAAGAKGTGSLMMMAKVKMSMAVTAAVMLIAAPVSMVAMQSLTRGAPPDSAAPVTEVQKLYSLKADEAVKYVPTPFVVGRDEFLAGARSNRGGGGFGGGGVGGGGGLTFSTDGQPRAPSGAIVLWDDKQPAQMTAGVGGPGAGYTIEMLLQNMVAGLGEEVSGDRNLLSRRLPGDFVVRRGATREQKMTALAKIISDQLNRPYALRIADVPREVYVLRGQWNFKALDENDEAETVQLFGKDRSDARGHGSGTTSAQSFASGTLGRFIHATVVIETKDMPPMIRYAQHYGDAPADPAEVLDHVAQQTGLTWAKEKRSVKTIALEEAKDTPGL